MAGPRKTRVLTKKYRNAEGFDELLGKLGTFADLQMKGNQLRYDIRGVLHKASSHVRNAAVQMAPAKPEDIKKALQSAYGEDKKKDPSTIVWALFKVSPWWHWWEFGTQNRTTKTGAFRGQIKAVKFLRRGSSAARGAVASDVASGLRGLFDKYKI